MTKEDKKFAISLTTYSKNGRDMLSGVVVTIGEQMFRDDEGIDVSLKDHPLYVELEEYVLANPSRKLYYVPERSQQQ
jgi:hypothetical protein